VLCTASVDEKVPPHKRGSGEGWVTAEYGMLPRATHTRSDREAAGQAERPHAGDPAPDRPFAARVFDLSALGERTILIDCDVLQADGGTRTAAITGAFVAAHDAVSWLLDQGRIPASPDPRLRGRGVGGHRRGHAAARPGIRRGLGLRHRHERGDDGRRRLRRGAGHGRRRALLARAEMDALLALADKGIRELVAAQRRRWPAGCAHAPGAGVQQREEAAELQALFAGLPLELVTQGSLGIAEAEEPHHTFIENAWPRRGMPRGQRLPALADDSGLCVDALGGAPGVISAHYAPRPWCRTGDRESRAARRTPPTTRCCCSAWRAAPTAARLRQHAGRVRHADDPEPLVACGRWVGEILQPRAAGRLRLRPADVHPGAGRQRGRTRRRGEERHSHRALAAAQLRALPARGLGPWLTPRPSGCTAPAALQLQALPPLALYVHLPWCLKKCPYCDFNSHEAPRRLPEARYLDALRADLERPLPLVWGRRVQQRLHRRRHAQPVLARRHRPLLADIRARLPLEPGCEVTLEANPGTFERDRFRAFRAAGVTRLSIGVQSFDDAHAAAHRPRARRRAGARRGRRGGAAFDTFNIDLMYALPGQDAGGARSATSTQALAFAPPHLSIYHLTLEPNTPSRTRRRRPARRRRRQRHAGPDRPDAPQARACSATRSRPSRGRATAARTT
jgi:inosine/xanthosine triphosphate pyrophosphatase family protein